MRYFIILFLFGSLSACQENQYSTENMDLAEEYGVAEMIDFALDVESIPKEEWIKFLETAVEMKKTKEFYKREHEKQKVIIEAFENELETAENEEQRQKVWNKYGAKYDWIVTSGDATN